MKLKLPQQFQGWKSQMCHLPTHQAAFEKWLFVHLGSVLLANKTGELLTFSKNEFQLSLDWRLKRLQTLASEWGCVARCLHETDHSAKVVIYRPEKAKAALNEAGPCLLHQTLGYPCSIEPDVFLSELARRWQTQAEIPHEVGLILGYPLKDVLGFMGLQPLQCTGLCGWRIYGDPSQSRELSQAFQQARQQAAVLMAL